MVNGMLCSSALPLLFGGGHGGLNPRVLLTKADTVVNGFDPKWQLICGVMAPSWVRILNTPCIQLMTSNDWFLVTFAVSFPGVFLIGISAAWGFPWLEMIGSFDLVLFFSGPI